MPTDYKGAYSDALRLCRTTLDDYLNQPPSARRGSPSPRAVERRERERAEIAALLREGDELWTWQGGEPPSTFGGLAVYRDGQAVSVWISWFSL